MSTGATFAWLFAAGFAIGGVLAALLSGTGVALTIIAGLIVSGIIAFGNSDPAGWIVMIWVVLSIPAVTGALSGLAIVKGGISIRDGLRNRKQREKP